MQELTHSHVSNYFLQQAFDLLNVPENYLESFGRERLYQRLSSLWRGQVTKKTLSVDDIPDCHKEPHIFRGYRPLSSFFGCIRSLFWLNNESFNCWSHILGIPLVIHFIIEEISQTSPDPIMLLYFFTALCFVLGSSFAHTFCCHKTLSNNASFIVDYVGLTIFSHGSGIAYVCYAFPMEFRLIRGLYDSSFSQSYMVLLCLCSSLSILQSVWTRTMEKSFIRNLLRASAFAFPGFMMSFPVLYKVFACTKATDLYHTGYCVSSELWPKQFISCIIGILFYVSHFPECIFPGKFDFVGNSHNLFHMASIVGLCYQKEALSLDRKFTKSFLPDDSYFKLPIACLSFLILSIICTCIYFRRIFTTGSQNSVKNM